MAVAAASLANEAHRSSCAESGTRRTMLGAALSLVLAASYVHAGPQASVNMTLVHQRPVEPQLFGLNSILGTIYAIPFDDPVLQDVVEVMRLGSWRCEQPGSATGASAACSRLPFLHLALAPPPGARRPRRDRRQLLRHHGRELHAQLHQGALRLLRDKGGSGLSFEPWLRSVLPAS